MRTAVLTRVTGIKDITKKDQNILKKIFSKLKLEEESKAQGKKKTTGKRPAPPKAATTKTTKSAAPAKKPAKAPAGSSFKEYTSSQYKEYKDIKEEEGVGELKNRLLTNMMPRTGTKADLVERIVDCKVLGAIPKCHIAEVDSHALTIKLDSTTVQGTWRMKTFSLAARHSISMKLIEFHGKTS